MKAIVKKRREPGFDYLEVDVPQPGPKDVLIKVNVAAICGSDLNCYHWNQWAQALHKVLPFIPGHEFSGEVIEAGPQVTAFRKGDGVVGETHIPCGRCFQCLTGQPHICRNLLLFGHTVDGCFGEYCLCPEVSTIKVPEGIPWEQAAMMEPLGTPLRAVTEAQVPGETVAVIGCGPIGLFAVGSARALGAASIVALDINEKRLAMAKDMGATVLLNPSADRVSEKIMEMTGGVGIGVIIEASGSVESIKEGFGYLRKGGKVFLIGLPKTPVPLDFIRDLILKEAHVTGIHGRRMYESWERTTAMLLAGRIDVTPVITHRFPLGEWARAFEIAGSGNAGKVLLIP